MSEAYIEVEDDEIVLDVWCCSGKHNAKHGMDGLEGLAFAAALRVAAREFIADQVESRQELSPTGRPQHDS